MGMLTERRVVEITDDLGRVVAPDWLQKAEKVHRQLRPQLADDYAGQMLGLFAAGASMAVLVEGDAVLGVSVWRIINNTSDGRRLFVDDLVSDEAHRSRGAGQMLLNWLETQARQRACAVLALDSGVQRNRAHRFYFREGMHVSSFCFKKELK